MTTWPTFIASLLAFAVFGAVVGLRGARELADVQHLFPPRSPLGDKYRGLMIVVTSTATVLPLVLLLMETWADRPVAGGVAVFGALPLALLISNALSGAYFAPRGFERGRLYRRLGVRLFKKLTPDGDLIVRAERRGTVTSTEAVLSAENLRALELRGRAAERAHVASLTAAIPPLALAILLGWFGYTAVLVVGNVIFHVYPIMLQRHTRIRLQAIALRAIAP